MKQFSAFILALSIVFAGAASTVARAANSFTGVVQHVSMNNIKVYNPRTGERLSFILAPSFDRVFARNGKETYQMRRLHKGTPVRVYYDQKAFGTRHADKIIVL